MLLRTSNLFIFAILLSGCGLFGPRQDSVDKLIEKASQQKIYYADYDLVWKAAHAALKYTIASENQDYGLIETDYIKAVDGWLPPDQTSPTYKSSRYKLIFSFAKGKTNNRDSTRVTIEKKIEIFKDFISETQVVPSDGLEEQTLFYRIERELIIGQALKKAAAAVE
ncbi:MAG: hypothetical protein K0R29_1709 [Pseudobdellovibrio sp.]|jgi:hypothetical protein|nr:hypothetical protein [Pseudobdellovibrio sp.]